MRWTDVADGVAERDRLGELELELRIRKIWILINLDIYILCGSTQQKIHLYI